MRTMTQREQDAHAKTVQRVDMAAQVLNGLPAEIQTEEDIAVAIARIDNWLNENRFRWVK